MSEIKLDRVWMRFSDGIFGRFIQKWSTEPFDGSDEFCRIANPQPSGVTLEDLLAKVPKTHRIVFDRTIDEKWIASLNGPIPLNCIFATGPTPAAALQSHN